jgi:small subunit ribosomal protein S1
MSMPKGAPLPPPATTAARESAAAAEAVPPSPAQEQEEPDDEALEQEFRAALEQLPAQSTFTPGEIREVRVVAITEDSVFVDVGDKAEGILSLQEFMDASGKANIEKGQIIPIEIKGMDSQTGQVFVSHRSAVDRLTMAHLEEAREKKLPVHGRVSDVVKGGLLVDVGLQAFMPASQTDIHRVNDLAQMVGQEVDVYVVELSRQRRRAVVSRRQYLEDCREEARKRLIGTIQVDQLHEGVVKNIMDFGLFVDLGGIDGFIPRDELSYDRGTSPSQLFQLGDTIQAKVIKADMQTGKITLSRKRLQEDPWENAEARFPVGLRVRGKVVSITHYGAFVHLDEGLTGMIHASDMSWGTGGKKKPSDYVNEGDLVEAQILEIDVEKRRMSLGLKQITMDPWIEVEGKYPVGSRVKGTVTSMTNYGAFVRLDENIEGMIHVSDMAWDKKIAHPNKVLEVNQEVECVVLKAEPVQRRLSLGIKQLVDSPFDQYCRAHSVGSLVTGPITRLTQFGAFVQLTEGVEGLIHISQIDEQRIDKPESVLKVGDTITCKILKVEPRNQKISLSRKEALKQMDRQFLQEYMRKDIKGGMSLGEALQAARKDTPAPQPPTKPAYKPIPPPVAFNLPPKDAPAPPAPSPSPASPKTAPPAESDSSAQKSGLEMPPLPSSLSNRPASEKHPEEKS